MTPSYHAYLERENQRGSNLHNIFQYFPLTSGIPFTKTPFFKNVPYIIFTKPNIILLSIIHHFIFPMKKKIFEVFQLKEETSTYLKPKNKPLPKEKKEKKRKQQSKAKRRTKMEGGTTDWKWGTQPNFACFFSFFWKGRRTSLLPLVKAKFLNQTPRSTAVRNERGTHRRCCGITQPRRTGKWGGTTNWRDASVKRHRRRRNEVKQTNQLRSVPIEVMAGWRATAKMQGAVDAKATEWRATEWSGLADTVAPTNEGKWPCEDWGNEKGATRCTFFRYFLLLLFSVRTAKWREERPTEAAQRNKGNDRRETAKLPVFLYTIMLV